MRFRELIVAGAVLSTASCETYEFPLRLRGIGTEDCPDCEELVLDETRLPQGDTAISARFAFADDEGSVSGLRVYVTTPSGEVVQEPYDVEERRTCEPDETPPCTDTVVRFRDGFTCGFANDESDTVRPTACELTAERFHGGLENTIAARLRGYNEGVLIATFGVSLDEFGEWSVEVEATRSDGDLSNRLSNTFEVAADVNEDAEE
jgi:hypothetical protein